MTTIPDVPAGLRVVQDGHVLRLTIDSPETRNALSDPIMLAMTDVFRAARNDRALRAIVVTGAGDKAFCAGANLKPGAKTFSVDFASPNTIYADLLRAAKACTIPLVARVNGLCLAGGMGLLTMCDMAVAAQSARFGLPEVRIGLFPMQVLALLKDVIPRRKLDELCITGELIGAEDALALGLVNHVAADAELDIKLEWLLDRILDKSPTAIRRGKYVLRAMEHMTFDQSLILAEAQIGTLALSEDATEGLAAFNEKRSPNWTGK
jgi:enoyl-CoA hydratase/carnithine racemase